MRLKKYYYGAIFLFCVVANCFDAIGAASSDLVIFDRDHVDSSTFENIRRANLERWSQSSCLGKAWMGTKGFFQYTASELSCGANVAKVMAIGAKQVALNLPSTLPTVINQAATTVCKAINCALDKGIEAVESVDESDPFKQFRIANEEYNKSFTDKNIQERNADLWNQSSLSGKAWLMAKDFSMCTASYCGELKTGWGVLKTSLKEFDEKLTKLLKNDDESVDVSGTAFLNGLYDVCRYLTAPFTEECQNSVAKRISDEYEGSRKLLPFEQSEYQQYKDAVISLQGVGSLGWSDEKIKKWQNWHRLVTSHIHRSTSDEWLLWALMGFRQSCKLYRGFKFTKDVLCPIGANMLNIPMISEHNGDSYVFASLPVYTCGLFTPSWNEFMPKLAQVIWIYRWLTGIISYGDTVCGHVGLGFWYCWQTPIIREFFTRNMVRMSLYVLKKFGWVNTEDMNFILDSPEFAKLLEKYPMLVHVIQAYVDRYVFRINRPAEAMRCLSDKEYFKSLNPNVFESLNPRVFVPRAMKCAIDKLPPNVRDMVYEHREWIPWTFYNAFIENSVQAQGTNPLNTTTSQELSPVLGEGVVHFSEVVKLLKAMCVDEASVFENLYKLNHLFGFTERVADMSNGVGVKCNCARKVVTDNFSNVVSSLYKEPKRVLDEAMSYCCDNVERLVDPVTKCVVDRALVVPGSAVKFVEEAKKSENWQAFWVGLIKKDNQYFESENAPATRSEVAGGATTLPTTSTTTTSPATGAATATTATTTTPATRSEVAGEATTLPTTSTTTTSPATGAATATTATTTTPATGSEVTGGATKSQTPVLNEPGFKTNAFLSIIRIVSNNTKIFEPILEKIYARWCQKLEQVTPVNDLPACKSMLKCLWSYIYNQIYFDEKTICCNATHDAMNTVWGNIKSISMQQCRDFVSDALDFGRDFSIDAHRDGLNATIKDRVDKIKAKVNLGQLINLIYPFDNTVNISDNRTFYDVIGDVLVLSFWDAVVDLNNLDFAVCGRYIPEVSGIKTKKRNFIDVATDKYGDMRRCIDGYIEYASDFLSKIEIAPRDAEFLGNALRHVILSKGIVDEEELDGMLEQDMPEALKLCGVLADVFEEKPEKSDPIVPKNGDNRSFVTKIVDSAKDVLGIGDSSDVSKAVEVASSTSSSSSSTGKIEGLESCLSSNLAPDGANKLSESDNTGFGWDNPNLLDFQITNNTSLVLKKNEVARAFVGVCDHFFDKWFLNMIEQNYFKRVTSGFNTKKKKLVAILDACSKDGQLGFVRGDTIDARKMQNIFIEHCVGALSVGPTHVNIRWVLLICLNLVLKHAIFKLDCSISKKNHFLQVFDGGNKTSEVLDGVKEDSLLTTVADWGCRFGACRSEAEIGDVYGRFEKAVVDASKNAVQDFFKNKKIAISLYSLIDIFGSCSNLWDFKMEQFYLGCLSILWLVIVFFKFDFNFPPDKLTGKIESLPGIGAAFTGISSILKRLPLIGQYVHAISGQTLVEWACSDMVCFMIRVLLMIRFLKKTDEIYRSALKKYIRDNIYLFVNEIQEFEHANDIWDGGANIHDEELKNMIKKAHLASFEECRVKKSYQSSFVFGVGAVLALSCCGVGIFNYVTG